MKIIAKALPALLAALGLAAPVSAQLVYDLYGPIADDEATAGEDDAAPADEEPSVPASSTPATPEAIEAFAEQVDRAIFACFQQTLDAEGRATQADLTRGGMTFSDTAPQAVQELANAEAMGGARYAQWESPDAVIWMIAYTRAPACRIMVAETRLAQPARDGIERRLLASDLWIKDEAQSVIADGVRRQIFNFDAPSSPNSLVLGITGRDEIERNGDGLQMMVSIAAFPRQGQPPAQPAQEPSR